MWDSFISKGIFVGRLQRGAGDDEVPVYMYLRVVTQAKLQCDWDAGGQSLFWIATFLE